jgi:hypothetical protein
MRARWALVAGLLLVTTVGTGAVAAMLLPRGVAEEGTATVGVLVASSVIWAALGALLVSKRPRNPLGWLLLLAGAGMNTGIAAWGYSTYAIELHPGTLPYPGYVRTLLGSAWLPATVVLLVLIPLTFPTGRPPTPGWRWVGWLGVAATMLLVGNMVWVTLRYPHLIAGDWDAVEAAAADSLFWRMGELGFPAILAAAVLAWISLLVRFRRSVDNERQQLKWFVFAVALTITHVVVVNVVPGRSVALEVVGGIVAMPSMAVAIAVAVLRYRLYEIDRIISRTVTYAVLTVMLVGIYGAGVLGLGALVRVMTGGGGSDVVVAASTLGVAAAFGPLRRRIQTLVDRRFNRRRYDAQQAIGEFTQGLRNEVDLDTLGGDLVHVADDALQPSMIGLWLRSEAPS